MTLHDAIAHVLREAGQPLTATEIWQRIVERDLYRGKDGQPPKLQQIYARISHYPDRFLIRDEDHPYTFELRPEGAATSQQEVTEKAPPPATGIWEGIVQDMLVTHLQAQGWSIRKLADTGSFERGPDVVAEREGRTLIFEVKGYPSSVFEHGANKGQPKKSSPGVQARHWFADALFSAIVRQTAFPDAQVALAFPHVPKYHQLLEKARWALQRLGLGFYFVKVTGEVVEALAPARLLAVALEEPTGS